MGLENIYWGLQPLDMRSFPPEAVSQRFGEADAEKSYSHVKQLLVF